VLHGAAAAKRQRQRQRAAPDPDRSPAPRHGSAKIAWSAQLSRRQPEIAGFLRSRRLPCPPNSRW
jgi:hypothetical protein